MKGVKYTIEFQTIDKGVLTFKNKLMGECIALIKELVKEHYDLDVKITNNVVYNLVHRKTCNKYLKKLCLVYKEI